ncbi:arginine deiminase [Romboutsia sedimentorum]|uniref:Arginine deiminase n=1 Tax=Romboutsia sedimentorum TaxID=1368474 RepID=A0ABT7EC09_9FIRM|nr:arginine deiminase [Romboutsia sedimentorum]MDK2564469.1 arginine deiminase [Romboutsia sedimentorum]MDK2586590.1 arginine deiminase [Romboutsia sedimentorum]
MGIKVTSEIKTLKKVLLHKPGSEIENLTPDYLERLLFDDIPFLEVAQQEHDAFAEILRQNGVEVVYLHELAAEVIADEEIKEQFIQQFIKEAGITSPELHKNVYEFLKRFKNNEDLIRKTMAGINKNELPQLGKKSLSDLAEDDYPFVADPMPNLYFTRDPFATIGEGVSLNKMYSVTRNRETLYADYIFKYHKDFKGQVERFYDRDFEYHIEGGDILNLTEKTLAIGISQRTQADAIEHIAKQIFFKSQNKDIETILAFNIPNNRAMMHLDTVFTQIDVDKFTIHPGIQGPLQVFEITKGNVEGELKIEELNAKLEDVLAKYLGVEKVTLIQCGGGDKVIADREQWNDGSNTLCIKPGEVVVYSRNYITNKLLVDNGIKIHVIPSSELSRGRGGPRCMSMPLVREV